MKTVITIAALLVVASTRAGFGQTTTVIGYNPVVNNGDLEGDASTWSNGNGLPWTFNGDAYSVANATEIGYAGPTTGSQGSGRFADILADPQGSGQGQLKFTTGTSTFGAPKSGESLISAAYTGVTSLDLSFDVAGTGAFNNNTNADLVLWDPTNSFTWELKTPLASYISSTPSQWTHVDIPITATTNDGFGDIFGTVMSGGSIGQIRLSFNGVVGASSPQGAIYIDSISLVLNPGGPGWKSDQSGDWNVGTNWNGSVPNGVDAAAVLGSTITQSRLIYTTTAVTLGSLTFDNSNSYTLAGAYPAGTLTMSSSATASIQVNQGTHVIDLPLTFSSNTNIDVAAGATLMIENPITLNGHAVTKTGSGTLSLDVNFQAVGGTLTANAGTVYVGAQAVVTPAAIGIDGSGQLAGAGQIQGANVSYESSANSTFAGSIAGAVRLKVDTDTGSLTLSGSNTYSGGTTIDTGVLRLGSNYALGSGSLAVNSNGTLDLHDFGPTITSLSGSGTILNSSSGTSSASVLTVTAGGTFGGAIRDGGLGGDAPVGLAVTGGTLILSGTNSFTGGTTVSAGMLILNTSEALADGSSLTVGDASAFAPVIPSAAASGQPLAAFASITPVPEPGTLVLLAAGGLVGLAVCRRRMKKQENGLC